ncbi:carbohydrate kinase family protein [Paenibacillus sp. HJGM_3]|uniref:carbohydrate kinase family protein n=1 Tax=Paenibacillus sp. HJGM_3 TaxID=3379816 RepID=UPI00385E183F
MNAGAAQVVVAGVICLDLIPQMDRVMGAADLERLLVPGRLVGIGPAVTATGGAVPNTGLALHRLGVPVRLMGKIGDDLFGRAISDMLEAHGEGLSADLIVSRGEMTSYTIVISPPGVDRIFLHCPGANHTFSAADVADEHVKDVRLFHFGYPPVMQAMYSRNGEQLTAMFERMKALGLTTSLDMAKPDPESEAGRVDWPGLLARLLPVVDIFMPSFEELLFMLDREAYDRLERSYGPGQALSGADAETLTRLADALLGMGAAVVGIKLGEHGLYLKTTADPARLERFGACRPAAFAGRDWLGRELLAPCYAVDAAGTTGAGDCTIAGFLAGLLQGLPLERVALGAVAVGACNVEQRDAVSGVPAWETVRRRMDAGWAQRAPGIALPASEWKRDEGTGLYFRIGEGETDQ